MEHELSARGSAFEDRHLAILAWSFGQLGHVPPPEARPPLLALVEARLPAMGGRSLATLVSGLAAMEQQRQWQQQQRRQQQGMEEEEQEQGKHSAAAGAGAAAAGSSEAGAAASAVAAAADTSPLVPQPLVAALVERTSQLAPWLQPFEWAQLVHGLSVLGSQAAAQRFLRSPSPQAAAQLEAAAQHAPLPAAVGLLWAMAEWQCYPKKPFAALCSRLRLASPHYRLPQPALAVLGEAVQAMGERQRAALGLRKGMAFAAEATARAAALQGPPGTLLNPGPASASGNSSSAGSSQDSDAYDTVSTADEGSYPQQQLQQQRHRSGQLSATWTTVPAAPQPACDNDNQDPGWLETTYDDLTTVM